MEHDVNTRMVHLERLLLAHGGASVTLDAAGDLDQSRVIAEMAALGFGFRGCDLHGFAWEAEFRHPAPPEQRPISGWATAYSEHAAVIEAAIAALQARAQPQPTVNGGPQPPQWTTWRTARPAQRRPRLAAPGLPSFTEPV